MVWIALICALAGAGVAGLIGTSGFTAGWSHRLAGAQQHEADLDGPVEPESTGGDEEPLWSSPEQGYVMMGLGAGVGIVLGVINALVIPIGWLAGITGVFTTVVAVVTVAPLMVSQVREDLKKQTNDHPTSGEGDDAGEGDQR